MHASRIIRSLMAFSPEVVALCEPLKTIDITMFSVLINYADGTQVNLSNKPQWLHDYYDLKLFESSLFDNDPMHYKTGYCIWPTESDLPVFRHGLTHFDSAYGATICHRKKEYTAFYFFSGSSKHPALIQFFINHMNFLEHFIYHFMHQGEQLIMRAKLLQMKRRIKTNNEPSTDPTLNCLLKHNNVLENKLDQIKSTLTSPAKSFQNLDITMSRRQKQVLYWCIKGKTAQETGEHLGIATKTVERHLELLRIKAGVSRKQELIARILENYLSLDFDY